MISFNRSFFAASIVILFASSIYAQSNSFPWPMSGAIGIGTKISPPFLPQNLLHLHSPDTLPDSEAIIRLSEGDSTTSQLYATMGLMPHNADTQFTSLSRGADFVLHEHSQGDMIFTNWNSTSLTHPFGAIRFATSPPSTLLPLISPGHHDLDRVDILPSGNIGIDLPPDSSIGGLGNPKEQLQLGGGSIVPPGELDPLPGLTFDGGNRFEGMAFSSGIAPVLYRSISFNHYLNHITGTETRFGRMSSSSIWFGDDFGGHIQLNAFPYDSGHSLSDFTYGISLSLTGTEGLSLYTADSTPTQYHVLFEVRPPGYDYPPATRNINGLTFFHTPLCISTDTAHFTPNFTNLPIRPNIGDDTTWLLAVNGPALFKEAFVNTNDWPDNVFLPEFPLPSLDSVEKFTRTNHHLPDLPSANQMAETGVPLGETTKALTKQVEELLIYIEQQNHRIDALETKVQVLQNQKGK